MRRVKKMLKVETIRKDTDNHYCEVEVSATSREVAIELTSLLETITEKGDVFAINVALSAYEEYLKQKNKESKDADHKTTE
jgi:hypothetical protein